MASDPETQPAGQSAHRDLFSDLIERVFEAGVQAFIVMMMGNIAVNMLSGIMDRMMPSPPPGLASATGGAGTLQAWWNALVSIKFYLIFAVLFYLSLREKYFALPTADTAAGKCSRWQRINQRFGEHWFTSIVGNAFLAMGLATALAAIPKFSAWQWAWQWLTDFAGSRLGPAMEQLPTAGWMAQVKAWFAWYGDNQLRFNFWVIYLGAMCDDFGIPNFKSLARWLWRRHRGQKLLSQERQLRTSGK